MGMRLPMPGMKYKSFSWAKPFSLCEGRWQVRWCPSLAPLVETLEKIAAKHIQIYACGACCRARSVAETDLSQWGAKFGSPAIFVSLVEWADRIITE